MLRAGPPGFELGVGVGPHANEERRPTLEDVEDVFAGQAPLQAPSRRSVKPVDQMS